MAEAKTQPSQEFEKALTDSATEVASFERHDTAADRAHPARAAFATPRWCR